MILVRLGSTRDLVSPGENISYNRQGAKWTLFIEICADGFRHKLLKKDGCDLSNFEDFVKDCSAPLPKDNAKTFMMGGLE